VCSLKIPQFDSSYQETITHLHLLTNVVIHCLARYKTDVTSAICNQELNKKFVTCGNCCGSNMAGHN
jgi:hypothetical protein